MNQAFLTGPKLQQDGRLILISWRFYQFVFTTDIVKFYRQFLVNPLDTDWLRILYVFDGKITDCRLTTVTYGTACAAFQALRAMNQLVRDFSSKYPNFYW